MPVEKTAHSQSAFFRPYRYYSRARDAFKAFLDSANLSPGEKVLLPAYIGWSPREGSGVFDPVRELGLPCSFYRMDERLQLDLSDLESKLAEGGIGVVVLIHYFGYVDPSYERAAALARAAGALILEDEAHAMLTDVVGGGCGRLGDACIFSLHKMLPTASGGMLVHNHEGAAFSQGSTTRNEFSPWSYDLFGIAQKRRRNAEMLTHLLQATAIPGIEPLWPELRAFEVPQTYPVLIRGVSRFALYTEMNDAGFGVVSLYHTLIDQLPRELFPQSHALADTILNLPVHQDVQQADLQAMVSHLRSAIARITTD